MPFVHPHTYKSGNQLVARLCFMTTWCGHVKCVHHFCSPCLSFEDHCVKCNPRGCVSHLPCSTPSIVLRTHTYTQTHTHTHLHHMLADCCVLFNVLRIDDGGLLAKVVDHWSFVFQCKMLLQNDLQYSAI